MPVGRALRDAGNQPIADRLPLDRTGGPVIDPAAAQSCRGGRRIGLRRMSHAEGVGMARHRQRADLACRSVRRRCERSGRPRLIGEAQHLVRHRSHGAEQEQHGAARDRQRHQHIQRTGERHQRTTYQAARCRIARDEEYGGIRYRGGCDGEQHGAQERDQRGLRCEAPGIMQQQSGRHAGDGDAIEDGHRRQAAIPAAKPIDHGDMAECRGDQQRLAEPR